MGIATAFHERTAPLCKSLCWKEWAGYFAVQRFGVSVDPEYFAIRESAGLLDVSPLYKYDLTGKHAIALADRILARDVTKLSDGQVAYCCWCDEDGKVIDDGAIFRFSETHLRLTSANPSYLWLDENAVGLEVEIRDTSAEIGALALQGPKSRDILKRLTQADLDGLRYFRMLEAKMDGFECTISRTGFTGDLGYEIWVDKAHAEKLWDLIMGAGRDYNIMPIGLLALDMARVEAGFILADCDYNPAFHCITEAQKSTPFEIGLGWTVHLNKRSFVGQKALAAEKRRGVAWEFVGLEIDMEELEKLYERRGLPVHLPCTAWRGVVPIFDLSRRQVGRATSGVWSPLLKKNLALATVPARFAKVGTELLFETLVEYDRELVRCRVVDKPFFDPPRKKAVL